MKAARGDVKKLVKKATKVMNTQAVVGDSLSSFEMIPRIKVKFSFYWGTHLSDDEFEKVFDLFVVNMLQFYQMSTWGYNPVSKRQELRATTSRYIIAKDDNGSLVGYLHYRFDNSGDSPILYCYEIQVDANCQKKGVGTALLSLAELIGKRLSMDKIMATVFTFNGTSLSFFHKMGFSLDPSSPEEEGNSDIDYIILSKSL